MLCVTWSCEKICKRCSFECGIGNYSTRPRDIKGVSVLSVDCTHVLQSWKFWTVVWENTDVFIFVRYGKIQHMSNEWGVRLIPWTVLYFPIPHSNEHRLHIIAYNVCSRKNGMLGPLSTLNLRLSNAGTMFETVATASNAVPTLSHHAFNVVFLL